LSYQLMWQHEGIYKEFEKVKKKHLNSQMVEGRILRCVSEEVRIV